MTNGRVRPRSDIFACRRQSCNAKITKNAKIAKEGRFRAVVHGTLRLGRNGDTSIDPIGPRPKAH